MADARRAAARSNAGRLPYTRANQYQLQDALTSQKRPNPSFNSSVTAPRWRLKEKMPAGTRGVHAVSKFGDGDGSFWDRWLGAEPPTVSCFRTGIVTTDRVPVGATAGRLTAARLQVAKQDRESGPEGAASVTTARGSGSSKRVLDRLKVQFKRATKEFAKLTEEMEALKKSYRAAQTAALEKEATGAAAVAADGGSEAAAAAAAAAGAEVTTAVATEGDGEEEEEEEDRAEGLELWRRQNMSRFLSLIGEREDAGVTVKRLNARMAREGLAAAAAAEAASSSVAAGTVESDAGAVEDILAMQQKHAEETRAERKRRMQKLRNRGAPPASLVNEQTRAASLSPQRAKYYGFGARKDFFRAAKNVLSPQFSAMKGDFPFQNAPDALEEAGAGYTRSARSLSPKARRIGSKPPLRVPRSASSSRGGGRDAIDELLGLADDDDDGFDGVASEEGRGPAVSELRVDTRAAGSKDGPAAIEGGSADDEVPSDALVPPGLHTFAGNFAGFTIEDEDALSSSFAQFDAAEAKFEERPSSFRREYVARCARLGMVPEPVAIRAIDAAFGMSRHVGMSAVKAVGLFAGVAPVMVKAGVHSRVLGSVGGWGTDVIQREQNGGVQSVERYANTSGRLHRAKSTYQHGGGVALALMKLTGEGAEELDPLALLVEQDKIAEARHGSLNFAHFSLGPKAAPLIESIACSWLPDVEYLNLRDNRLSPETANRLLDVVRLGMPDLASLDISQNLGVGTGCADQTLDATLENLAEVSEETASHFDELISCTLAELAGDDEATELEEALSQRMRLFDAVVAANRRPDAIATTAGATEDGETGTTAGGARNISELIGAHLAEVGVNEKSANHSDYLDQLRAYGVGAEQGGEGGARGSGGDEEELPIALPLPLVSASSLCDLLRFHAKLQCLRLSECGVTATHLEAIAMAMCSHRQGCGFDAPPPALRVLDLSHNARTLCTVGRTSSDWAENAAGLETVAGDVGSAVAAAALIALFSTPTNLSVLDLSHNGIGGFVARGVARAVARPHCKLRALHLAHNSFGRSGMREILVDEEGQPTGRSLGGVGGEEPSSGVWGVDVAGENPPADVGTPAEQLGVAISANSTLELVDLSYNGIAAVPCIVLAHAAWLHRKLRGLHMSGNPIGSYGAAALLRCAATRIEPHAARVRRCADFMRLYGGVEETDSEPDSSSSDDEDDADFGGGARAASVGTVRTSTAGSRPNTGLATMLNDVGVGKFQLSTKDAEEMIGLQADLHMMNNALKPPFYKLLAQWDTFDVETSDSGDCLTQRDDIFAYVQQAFPTISCTPVVEHSYVRAAMFESEAEVAPIDIGDALDTLITTTGTPRKNRVVQRRASTELTGIWATEARDVDGSNDDGQMDRGEFRWMIREMRRVCLMRVKYIGSLSGSHAKPMREWLESSMAQTELTAMHHEDVGEAPEEERKGGNPAAMLWATLELASNGNLGTRRTNHNARDDAVSPDHAAEADDDDALHHDDHRYDGFAPEEGILGDRPASVRISHDEIAMHQGEKMRAKNKKKEKVDRPFTQGLRSSKAPHLPPPPFEVLMANCDANYDSPTEPASELFGVTLAMAPGEFDSPGKAGGYALDLSRGIEWASAVALVRLARRYPLSFVATPPSGSEKIVAEAEREKGLAMVEERLAAWTKTAAAAAAAAAGPDADGTSDYTVDADLAAAQRTKIDAAVRTELGSDASKVVGIIVPADKKAAVTLITDDQLRGVHANHGVWVPPHRGTLKFAVLWQQLPRSTEDAIDDTQLLSVAYALRNMMGSACSPMVELITSSVAFTAVQGRRFLNLVRPPNITHVVGAMMDNIVDDPDTFRETTLTPLQNKIFAAFVGQSAQFDPLNPIARYRLQRCNRGDMVIFRKLLEISNLEHIITKKHSWPDVSQNGQGTGFRNAYVEKRHDETAEEKEAREAREAAGSPRSRSPSPTRTVDANLNGGFGGTMKHVSVVINGNEENAFMKDPDVKYINFDFVSVVRPAVRHAIGHHNGHHNGHHIGKHGHHHHHFVYVCSVEELWHLLRSVGLRSGIEEPLLYFQTMAENVEKERKAGDRPAAISRPSTAQLDAQHTEREIEARATALLGSAVSMVTKIIKLGRSVRRTLKVLRRALSHGDVYLSSNQVATIMKCFPREIAAARIEVAVICFNHVLDLEDYLENIAHALGSRRDVVRLAERLGWLNLINPHKPAHFYYFRLEYRDEWRALQLLAILGREPGENWVGEWYSAIPECLSGNAAEAVRLFDDWKTQHGEGWATFLDAGEGRIKIADASRHEPWSTRPMIEVLHRGCDWELEKGGAHAKKPTAWEVSKKFYDTPHTAFGRVGVSRVHLPSPHTWFPPFTHPPTAVFSLRSPSLSLSRSSSSFPPFLLFPSQSAFFYYMDPNPEQMARMDEPISARHCEMYREGAKFKTYTTHTGRREAMCHQCLIAVERKLVDWPTDPHAEEQRRLALQETEAEQAETDADPQALVMRDLAQTQMRMMLLLARPHELNLEWKELDNNHNGEISISEIDSWLALRFPEISHKASRKVRLQAFTVTYKSKPGEKHGIYRRDFVHYLRNLLSFMELQCIFSSIASGEQGTWWCCMQLR